MRTFFTGDELGSIKALSYTPGDNSKEWKSSSAVLVAGGSSGRAKAIQKLAVHPQNDSASPVLLAAVHADSSASVYKVTDRSQVEVVHEWSEARLKEGQRFVGLSVTERGAFSCTSNGALRLTRFEEEGGPSQLATLPMRLCDWHLAEDGSTFAYGGDEVELSLWDTERAFSGEPLVPAQAPSDSKKRKRGDQLLPGEIWRAKNLPNDHLNLRQPVHNTALAYLRASTVRTDQHLITGTASGSVRRYDTRAGRRPVANWKSIAKVGGIGAVATAHEENEIFVADQGSTVSALDLRNGRTIYSYKGISGAVTSLSPSPSFLASASQDRFIRFCSTFNPPAEAGGQQERKGDVLDKLYVKVVPTAIVWDGRTTAQDVRDDDSAEDPEDNVWDTMEAAESDDEEDAVAGKKTQKRKKTSKLS